MTWSRQPACWRDFESVSAAFVAGAGVLLAAALTFLPPNGVPRCLLKMLTGVPCLTCGAYRALKALLDGHLIRAVSLQPLLTMLAFAAVAWVGYAIAGALFRLPRFRMQASRYEQRLLVAGAAILVVANWVYLIAAGV